MEKVGTFPALLVSGTQGSGKSSMCIDLMWPMFGVRDAEPYRATDGVRALEAPLLDALGASLHRRVQALRHAAAAAQRLNTLHRHLRRLYRGEVEEHGRPDLKVVSYQLQAPVCVAGETRPTESALIERIITSNPDKTTLAEKPGTRLAYKELRALNLLLFAPRYIQFCFGRDFDADVRAGYVPCNSDAADLLFRIISKRHESRAVVITTNLPYKQWGTVFGDAPCLGALVNRFAKHCHVFDIDADSWREKERKEGLHKKRALKKPR